MKLQHNRLKRAPSLIKSYGRIPRRAQHIKSLPKPTAVFHENILYPLFPEILSAFIVSLKNLMINTGVHSEYSVRLFTVACDY